MNTPRFFQSQRKWLMVLIGIVVVVGLIAGVGFAFQRANFVSAASIFALTTGQQAALQGAEIVLFQPDTTSTVFLPLIER